MPAPGPTAPRLNSGRKPVCVPDQPGAGASDPAPGPRVLLLAVVNEYAIVGRSRIHVQVPQVNQVPAVI